MGSLTENKQTKTSSDWGNRIFCRMFFARLKILASCTFCCFKICLFLLLLFIKCSRMEQLRLPWWRRYWFLEEYGTSFRTFAPKIAQKYYSTIWRVNSDFFSCFTR